MQSTTPNLLELGLAPAGEKTLCTSCPPFTSHFRHRGTYLSNSVSCYVLSCFNFTGLQYILPHTYTTLAGPRIMEYEVRVELINMNLEELDANRVASIQRQELVMLP